MKDVLRFLVGGLFLAVATLTVVPAPTHLLWKASLAATEWGYWLAFAALLPMIPTRNQGKLAKMGTVLSLGAIVLFVMPVVKAMELSRELPASFNQRFKFERRVRAYVAESRRPEPLVLSELIRPQELPAIRYSQRIIPTPDGQKIGIDVYRPAYVHESVPGVLVVQGGTWQSTSTDFANLNAYLASRDYVVAVVTHQQTPRPFPASRDDVLAAVAYLKVFGHEFGMDASRIVLLGRSTAAPLALLAAYTAAESSIKGVISMYGPTDMRFGYDHPASPRVFDTRQMLGAYLGGPPSAQPDAYFSASPINFVNASSPPTLLIHGALDSVVSPLESQRLEAKLQEFGVKNLFVRMPWATHGCDTSFTGPCGQVATYAVERFLDGVIIAPPAPESQIKARRDVGKILEREKEKDRAKDRGKGKATE
jgi:acetyl esterase/lipase